MTMKSLAIASRRMPREIAAVCLLSLLTVAPIARAAGAPTAVTPIGSFGALRTSGEHCEGHSVDLWQSAGSLLGVMRSCAGLIDTMQTSVIRDQRYDEGTGAVDFTASFSMGTDYLGGSKEVPSKDEWMFRGRLRREGLSGTLTMADKNYSDAQPHTEKVLLKKQRKTLPTFADADAWMQWAVSTSSKQP